MTGRPSIRRRLVQRLSALYLIALVLSSALFLFRAWSNRIDTLDRSLRQAASGLASTIETRDSARLRIPDSAALALAPAEITFLRYAVADQRSGTVAEGSSQSLLKDLGGRIPEGRLQGGFDFRDGRGVRQRGYLATAVRGDVPLAVVVSSATLSLADTLAWTQDETLREVLPVLAPLFIGTLVIAPFTIRSSLRPLGRLSAEVATMEPSRTHVRLGEDDIPLEILPLVQSFNNALGRIDEGFEQQRRFTTNAAHELRTPLAILRARIDSLENGPAKTGLVTDVERMTRLVSQLLLAGRLEMQLPSFETPVDLVEVARETVNRLAPLELARGHELKLRLPGRPVEIQGDEESLGDALRNLIDNALDCSPAGQPVEIEVTGDRAVEVRDRGPGIPPEHREQIFERFWRARKANGEGAGLGLSIVRAIMARHCGTITVGDNPRGGAVFRLQFPKLSLSAAAEGKQSLRPPHAS